jgi:hypothetical protein
MAGAARAAAAIRAAAAVRRTIIKGSSKRFSGSISQANFDVVHFLHKRYRLTLTTSNTTPD